MTFWISIIAKLKNPIAKNAITVIFQSVFDIFLKRSLSERTTKLNLLPSLSRMYKPYKIIGRNIKSPAIKNQNIIGSIPVESDKIGIAKWVCKNNIKERIKPTVKDSTQPNFLTRVAINNPIKPSCSNINCAFYISASVSGKPKLLWTFC